MFVNIWRYRRYELYMLIRILEQIFRLKALAGFTLSLYFWLKTFTGCRRSILLDQGSLASPWPSKTYALPCWLKAIRSSLFKQYILVPIICLVVRGRYLLLQHSAAYLYSNNSAWWYVVFNDHVPPFTRSSSILLQQLCTSYTLFYSFLKKKWSRLRRHLWHPRLRQIKQLTSAVIAVLNQCLIIIPINITCQ